MMSREELLGKVLRIVVITERDAGRDITPDEVEVLYEGDGEAWAKSTALGGLHYFVRHDAADDSFIVSMYKNVWFDLRIANDEGRKNHA